MRSAAALGVEIARGLAASHEAAVARCTPPARPLRARPYRAHGLSESPVRSGETTASMGSPTRAGPFGHVDLHGTRAARRSTHRRRADVYSLGCILFQLVTGRLRQPRGSEPLARTVVAPPGSTRSRARPRPGSLTDVIRRPSTRPGDRYPNADAAAEALPSRERWGLLACPAGVLPRTNGRTRSVAVLPLAKSRGGHVGRLPRLRLAEHITDDLSRHATLGVRPFAASYDAARSGQGAVATGRALGPTSSSTALARTGHEVTLTVRMTSVGDGFQILAWRAT